MAVENVWIIDSLSGICIYDWCHETKDKTIDEQLVSGLLLAFKNFSSEAGLVDISAIEGIDRKLAYQSDDRFIIASICHSKDYEPLINKTLQGLLKDFRKKYKKHLEDSSSDVSPFRTFDEDLETKLEGSSSSRTWISLCVGAIIGMLTIGVFFIAYYFIINISSLTYSTEIGFIALLVGYILAGMVSGIIAGDRRFGLISAFLTVLPIFPLVVVFTSIAWTDPSIIDYIYYSLLYFMLFVIFSMMGGLIGGFIKERKFFYPMISDI